MTRKTITMSVMLVVTIAIIGLATVIPTQQANAEPQQPPIVHMTLLNAINSIFDALSEDIANLSTDINNISVTGSNHTDSFDTINENISTLNLEIYDLSTEVSELSDEIISTITGTQMNNVKTYHSLQEGYVFIESTYGYTGTVCMIDMDLSNGGWLVVKRNLTEHSIFPTEENIEYCANIGSEGGETLTIFFHASTLGSSTDFVYGNITIVGQANDPTLGFTE